MSCLSQRISRSHGQIFTRIVRNCTTAQQSHQNKSSDQSRTNSHRADDPQTHFGYRNVPLSSKQTLVSSVFSSVAPSYDLMNDYMSLRIHRLWKAAFVQDMSPSPDANILDCAGGTGDIAQRIEEEINTNGGWRSGSVTVADVNEQMLQVGRERLPGLKFVLADAQNLPFDDQSFDIYSISFGMRNVPRPEDALKEAIRVLKPGGRFMMLEFAKVTNPIVSRVYDTYSFDIIPRIGKMIAGDEDAYRYLVESIRRFPDQHQFVEMMKDAGFSQTTVTDYSFGIAACYSGFKPPG